MFKDILRWGVLGGLFAIPLIIPFIVAETMFFPYITGKNFTFRIIVELVFAGWVLLALVEPKYRPRFSWLLVALAAFLVIVGLADLQGANVFKSFWSNFERMEGYVALVHLFAYFLVLTSMLNTKKLWDAFWYATLGTSVIVAMLGLNQVFDALSAGQSLPRADATFGNPIYLAIYALFHIFIALILIVRWRGTIWHQVALGALALVHVAVLILTQTRGTAIGLMGGILVASILVALFERERKALRLTAIAGLTAVVVLVGSVLAIKDTPWAQQTLLIGRFTQYDFTGGTIKARFMNWGMAWEGVKERPILGYGQDNYEYVFSKHYDPNMFAEEPWFDRTHNLLFDWLIAAGILGALAYFAVYAAILAHLWLFAPGLHRPRLSSLLRFEGIRALFAKREHDFPVAERALWTGLLVAYLLHNLVVFDNIVSYIFYFSVLAYLASRITAGHPPLFEKRTIPEETLVPVAVPVALVAAVIVVIFFNRPGILTAQELIRALQAQGNQNYAGALAAYKDALAHDQLGRQEVREQLVQSAVQVTQVPKVDVAVRDEFLQLAEAETKREVERNPDSARLRLFLGNFYMNTGRYDLARAELEKAVELTPTKQNALYQRGQAELIMGDTAAAVETFKTAFELVPRNDEARRLYAYALIKAGRDKEAVDLLTEAYGTAALDDTRLMQAWSEAKRFDLVVPVLEARITANPDDIQQRVSLAAAYAGLGQKAKAIEILEKIKKEQPQYASQMDGFIAELKKK